MNPQSKIKRPKRTVDGVLLLNKPQGGSSNQILQRVKYLFQAKKAGHTGALDPLASGLLPICFGEATKFSQFLLDADKQYDVVMKLGERTTTSDAEGEVISAKAVPVVSKKVITSLFNDFLGEQEQVPSMYSALKYEGKPLYYYARKGIQVPRKSRSITIFSIDVAHVSEDSVSFSVHCSKGTYVRTLVDDFGEKLGCGAHVTYLHRTKVGPYDLDETINMECLQALLDRDGLNAVDQYLLSVDTPLLSFPAISLDKEQAQSIWQGKVVALNQSLSVGQYRLYHDSYFIGLGEILENSTLISKRLVAQSA